MTTTIISTGPHAETCRGCLRPKTDGDYEEVRCVRCNTEMCGACFSCSPVEGDEDAYCKRCAQERLDEEDEEENGEEFRCDRCEKTFISCDGEECPHCGYCPRLDEEETDEAIFDRKYPKATCHRCDEPVTGATVIHCGGGGGACETWYCEDCHEDGTDDCRVCHA